MTIVKNFYVYLYNIFCLFNMQENLGIFVFVSVPVNVARVNITQRFADCLELSWEKVKSNNISYILKDSSKAENTIAASDKDSVMTHIVSSLSPGTRYSFTLYTVFDGIRSRGLNFTSSTGFFYLSIYLWVFSCFFP